MLPEDKMFKSATPMKMPIASMFGQQKFIRIIYKK